MTTTRFPLVSSRAYKISFHSVNCFYFPKIYCMRKVLQVWKKSTSRFWHLYRFQGLLNLFILLLWWCMCVCKGTSLRLNRVFDWAQIWYAYNSLKNGILHVFAMICWWKLWDNMTMNHHKLAFSSMIDWITLWIIKLFSRLHVCKTWL